MYYMSLRCFLIAGCGLVAFLEPESTPGFSFLRQESQNPVVYSKLSCHLPWIAEQYDMDFDAIDTDPECLEAVGSEEVSDEDTRECRAVSPEEKCIFPFYLNGERYDSCAMMEQDGFLFRVYLCPIYNITTKIDGINSFTYDDYVQQV